MGDNVNSLWPDKMRILGLTGHAGICLWYPAQQLNNDDDEDGDDAEFPFTHSCAYLTHKNLKRCSLFHASASQGRMEACSFQSHLSAY